MAKNKKTIEIETDGALKLIEREIREVAAAVKRLEDGPVKMDTVIELVYAQTRGISRSTIKTVFEVARDLPKYCLKPVKPAKP